MPLRLLVARFGGGRTVALPALILAFCGAGSRAAEKSPRVLLLDAALAAPHVVAVGEYGTILRSSDHARTWEPAASATQATLTGVAFAPPSSEAPPAASPPGWAVGHDAIILGSSDGGRTWTKQFQGDDLQDSFLDVIAIDAQHVIAVGAYGLFVSSRDAGKTWVRRKLSEEDYHLNRISRDPNATLYIAGERGTLLRSTDRGAHWEPIHAPYEGSFYGVLPLGDRTLLAYGLRGRVYRSSDDGATWSAVSTPHPALLATGIRTTGNNILIAGQAGTLLLSRDAGKSFTAAAEPPATAMAELLALPDATVLAVGEAGATLLPPPR